MSRTVKRLFAALCVLVITSGSATAAGALSTSPSAAESQFLRLLNTERVDAGLAPLVRDGAVDAVALAWSSQMAADNLLHHRPNLAEAITQAVPGWTRGGENVGVGGEVQALHTAFMNSAPHRANVLGDFNRIGVGVVADGDRMWVTFNFVKAAPITGVTGLEQTPPTTDPGPTTPPGPGDAPGSNGDYWLTTTSGDVYAFGEASFLGDLHGHALNKPIVGMAPTPTGAGYWLVASDGGIFAFGDAAFYGSTGNLRLNRPINGMSATPSGEGYWMVASDGGIFAFGDAAFYGSTGDRLLPSPVTGVATTPTGDGYWLVEADGTVVAFGDADSYGSVHAAGAPLSRIATMPDGHGYRMAASDGRVFSFGSAGSGVTEPISTKHPVVALANRPATADSSTPA